MGKEFHPILIKLVEFVVHMESHQVSSKSDEKQKSFIHSPFLSESSFFGTPGLYVSEK